MLKAKEDEPPSVNFHSIDAGVITTDITGNIFSINRVAEKITGWKRKEVLGKPLQHVFQIILDERESVICKNPLGRLLRYDQGKVLAGHIKLFTKNKARKAIFANTDPIRDKRQDTVGYVIVFKDITRQKRFETPLLFSQKLQSIGEMTAGIAHEIITPMQYIGINFGFLQNTINDIIYDLLDDYKQLKNTRTTQENVESLINKITKKEQDLEINYLLGEIPKVIQEMKEGIAKVNKLVQAIKEFVHPGKKEKSPADINKVIEGAVTISRNEWKYVAELETDLEPGLPLVHCVPDEINQVLLNLIVNAAQAVKEAQKNKFLNKGKIKITTSNDKGYVNILIYDNGIGIPEVVIDNIFDPFFTTKEVGTGSGQGLAIARDIITTRHQGNIQVNSKVGKGTLFSICLPVKSCR